MNAFVPTLWPGSMPPNTTSDTARNRHESSSRAGLGKPSWRAAGIAMLCAGLAAPQTSLAEPSLYVGIGHPVGESSCFPYLSQTQSTGPLTLPYECNKDLGHGAHNQSIAYAEADYGMLRSSVYSSTPSVDPGWSVSATGSSTARFSGDYIFTGPEGSKDVSTQLNLNLDGHIALTANDSGGDNTTFKLKVDVFPGSLRQSVSLTLKHPHGGGPIGLSIVPGYSGYSLLDSEADWASLASPAGAHLDVQTQMFTVPTGTPIRVELEMATSFAIVGSGLADSYFASTLTFNRDEVFELPEGYTVNGPGVVNNHWVGAIPAVPEPATALLSALGLGVVSWRVRRRRVTWTRG